MIFVKPMRCYRCNGRFYCPPTIFFQAVGHGQAGEGSGEHARSTGSPDAKTATGTENKL